MAYSNLRVPVATEGEDIAGDQIDGDFFQRGKLGFGTEGNFIDVSAANPLPISTPDPLSVADSDSVLEILKGNISGHTIMSAMGERESMSTTPQGEDLWRGNELSPAPTSHTTIPTPNAAGEQMSVISESADDNISGTGVQKVEVHYLNAAGAEQTEIVDMDGETPADLSASDVRFVNEFHTYQVGSNGVAAGNIKIWNKGDNGLVYNMIATGGNMSLVPHRMVPAGKTLYLMMWHAEEAQGRRCAVRIRSTDHGGILIPNVFIFKSVSYLNATTSGALPLATKVPALSIVKVSGWPDAVGAEASCCWHGILE
jgi:hypothetical protein